MDAERNGCRMQSMQNAKNTSCNAGTTASCHLHLAQGLSSFDVHTENMHSPMHFTKPQASADPFVRLCHAEIHVQTLCACPQHIA